MSTNLTETSGTTTPNTIPKDYSKQEFYKNKAMFRIAFQLKDEDEGMSFNDAVKMTKQLARVAEFNELVRLEKNVLQNHNDKSKEAIEKEMQTLVQTLVQNHAEKAEQIAKVTKVAKEAAEKAEEKAEQIAKVTNVAKKAIKNARQRTTLKSPGSTQTGGKRRKPRKTKKHRKKKSL